MAETNPTLTALFTDIADAIREKTGETDLIIADDFPDVIRKRLRVIPPLPAYLTFSSPNSFTLKVNDTTKHWDGTLEYSTDASTWSTWGGTTTLSSATSGSDNVLYLRGTGNTVITGSDSNYRWVLTGSDISCIGNIENLLDYATVEAGQHPTMAEACYYQMFNNCTSLTQAPALPATTLTDYCYGSMFLGCTNLIQAPELSATTLANYCYSSMFQDCTSLTQAPALPATTLTDYCYQSMFYGCTALTQAPALPATTLTDYCYGSMFRGCTSLTQAPALPATTLANFCYQSMFSGCTGLTQAPALPSTTLANWCYQHMFYNCTALTQAPALPATTLRGYCYQSMFYGCTSLTQAPALPATTLANYCYQGMFRGCTGLKLSTTQTGEYTQEYRIPSSGTGTTVANALTDMFTDTGGTFTGTPEINTTYYFATVNVNVNYLTFSSPNSFTLKVNDATKHWDGTLEYSTDTSTWTTWGGTTTLSSVDNDGEYVLYLRGTGNTKITGDNTNYKWVFTGSDISCIGNIENLLDYATVESGAHPTMATDCYNSMFYGCTALTQAPALPATTLTEGCYYYMFTGCTSLTQAPALPATTLTTYCYQYMFNGCTGLTQAPALPATTLASNCYNSMFMGCTGLTQAPALPATTLATSCYFNMFMGCTALTQAPSLPATTLKNSCYYSMFRDCTGLKLSTTQTGEYTVAYRIPTTGTGTALSNALNNMFTGTGGTFTGTPEINKTYYFATVDVDVNYLTFSSPNSFTLAVGDTTKHWNGTLEYSTDTSTWATWDGTTTLSSAASGSDNVLCLRGTGNTVITGNNLKYKWVLTGSDIACIGNIEYLLDYATVQSGAHPTMANYCYYAMFTGCTSLTQAPALPATTLANYCYQYMFNGCTGLTQAPALPATTLTSDCYSSMFSGCTSLTQAPALPATTLTDYCYESMFYNCTSLTQAPALPATTLAVYCYCQMFAGCTALTQAPALPSTTLTFSCYFAMFRGCTSLKLSSTQTGEYTVAYRIPTTGTGTMITSALTDMFSSTGGTFTGTPAINTTYYLSNTNTIA